MLNMNFYRYTLNTSRIQKIHGYHSKCDDNESFGESKFKNESKIIKWNQQKLEIEVLHHFTCSYQSQTNLFSTSLHTWT
jgi:hypothetical protein